MDGALLSVDARAMPVSNLPACSDPRVTHGVLRHTLFISEPPRVPARFGTCKMYKHRVRCMNTARLKMSQDTRYAAVSSMQYGVVTRCCACCIDDFRMCGVDDSCVCVVAVCVVVFLMGVY